MNARSALLAAALSAALVVTGCTSSTGSGTYRFSGATKVGKLIPVPDRKPAGDVQAPLLDGKGTYRLGADKGKVVVVNFWATWCAPCRVESPQLDLLYRSVRNKGVTIVGIDTKDRPSQAKSFVADNKISYPIAYDEQGKSIITLGNIPSDLPFTVLIDRGGRVAAVYLGALTPKDLQAPLAALRAET
jgi:thiol-disulfide isomerase/thioredoxin